MDVLTNEPRALRAGVNWAWRREDLAGDFPANGGWALTYWFKKTGAVPGNFSIAAVASGVYFAVSELAAATAARVAGDYTWTALVVKTTDTFEVDTGILTILPRYDAVENIDDRSHARKMLEAINAVLESRATSTQREMVGYTIGSRSQQFDQAETKQKLLDFKSHYEWLVDNEENREGMAEGKPNRRDVRIRFTSP